MRQSGSEIAWQRFSQAGVPERPVTRGKDWLVESLAYMPQESLDLVKHKHGSAIKPIPKLTIPFLCCLIRTTAQAGGRTNCQERQAPGRRGQAAASLGGGGRHPGAGRPCLAKQHPL